MNISLSTWMNDIYEWIQNKPLNEVKIYGSHDSGTSEITWTSPLDPSYPLKTRIAGTIFPCITARYSKTQNLNIAEQLEHGARYFDMRPQYYDDRCMYTHAKLDGEFFEGIEAMKDFVDTHPKEILICHLRQIKGFDHRLYQALYTNIKAILGGRIAPTSEYSPTTTISKFVDTDRRIIVITCGPDDDIFWPERTTKVVWPDQRNPQDCLEYMLREDKEFDPSKRDQMLILTAVLTPNQSYVIRHPLSTVQELAESLNTELIHYVQNYRNTCGILVDVIETPELAINVIEMNVIEILN